MVAAAGIGRLRVLRRDPDGSDAEVLEVRNALAEPGDVATVPLRGVRGVEAAGDAAVVVRRVAVLENGSK